MVVMIRTDLRWIRDLQLHPDQSLSELPAPLSSSLSRRLAGERDQRSHAVRKGLRALDPQLVSYSWINGISEVAQVVFVRKRLVEIQYLHTTITDGQRREFSQLVHNTIGQIEAAQFLPHSGIRFPQSPCSTCPYVGLCLGKPALSEATLMRRAGAHDFGVFDELTS